MTELKLLQPNSYLKPQQLKVRKQPTVYVFLLSGTSLPFGKGSPLLLPSPVHSLETRVDVSSLTFLVGIVVKGPFVEDTPPLLPLRPKKAVV